MKNLFKPLLLLLLLAGSALWQDSFAYHYSGGDITYEFMRTVPGTNEREYRVIVTWVIDNCKNGVTDVLDGGDGELDLHVEGCSFNQDLQLTVISSELLTKNCLNAPCSTSSIYTESVHICTTTVTLPAQACANYTFSVKAFERDQIISTGPNGDMYLESTLSNIHRDHSSPTFQSLFPTYLCVGEPYYFNHQTIGNGNDVLSYSLVSPLQDQNNPVGYFGGLSFTQPLVGPPSTFQFDNTTGAITGTPTQQGISTTAMLVTQKDLNGNVIGTVMREFHLFVSASCSNPRPTVFPANSSYTICVGDGFQLFTIGSDPNNDLLTMSWGGEISGATFSVTNNNTSGIPVQGAFDWTPTVSDLGWNTFTVRLDDDGCLVNGYHVYTYSIFVEFCCDTADLEVRTCRAFPEIEALNCDPCQNGFLDVWVSDQNGNQLQIRNNPCISLDWFDNSGATPALIGSGPSFSGVPNTDYLVRVYDQCSGCTWIEEFNYRCCEYGNWSFGTNPAQPSCTNPNQAFQLGYTGLPTGFSATPTTSYQWSSSVPNSIPPFFVTNSWIPGYPGITYYVEVTDGAGCVHRDTFLLPCCDAPTNLSCGMTLVNGSPKTILFWDNVPGATNYTVKLNTGDATCCTIINQLPSSTNFSANTNFLILPYLVNGNSCASWSVTSNCPSGFSSSSPTICLASTCMSPTSHGPGGGGDGEGRQGFENDADLSIYPSPASNFVTVESPDLSVGTTLHIVDLSGKTVLTQAVEVEGKQRLNTSELPTGIYFLQIPRAGKHTLSKKIVIQK